MEDSCIVDLFLQRDEGAIAETASKYGKRLHHFAYGIVENDEDADECVNDAYLSAWNAIPPHEPRTYLLAFLLRILRHISLDLVRKQHRQNMWRRHPALARENDVVCAEGGYLWRLLWFCWRCWGLFCLYWKSSPHPQT